MHAHRTGPCPGAFLADHLAAKTGPPAASALPRPRPRAGARPVWRRHSRGWRLPRSARPTGGSVAGRQRRVVGHVARRGMPALEPALPAPAPTSPRFRPAFPNRPKGPNTCPAPIAPVRAPTPGVHSSCARSPATKARRDISARSNGSLVSSATARAPCSRPRQCAPRFAEVRATGGGGRCVPHMRTLPTVLASPQMPQCRESGGQQPRWRRRARQVALAGTTAAVPAWRPGSSLRCRPGGGHHCNHRCRRGRVPFCHRCHPRCDTLRAVAGRKLGAVACAFPGGYYPRAIAPPQWSHGRARPVPSPPAAFRSPGRGQPPAWPSSAGSPPPARGVVPQWGARLHLCPF